eukprot:56967-Chlamydomonas_euryale.AAC.1
MHAWHLSAVSRKMGAIRSDSAYESALPSMTMAYSRERPPAAMSAATSRSCCSTRSFASIAASSSLPAFSRSCCGWSGGGAQ